MTTKFELYKGPYNPEISEQVVLDFWLSKGFYKPEYNKEKKSIDSIDELKDFIKVNPDKKFCIIAPPPNAYGRPHLGNISGYAYQDLLARYWRMKGKRVLILPGKDHAGIQGEIVVLREYFAPKGKNKSNLTREEFYNETYKYFEGMRHQAQNDEKRIGLSADYERDTFTLDPEIVQNYYPRLFLFITKVMFIKAFELLIGVHRVKRLLLILILSKKNEKESSIT